MPGKQLFSDVDGLPARDSQLYALEKLHYVGHYQRIFATGMKNFWRERVYLDLLAGPGVCKIDQTGQEFAGSPLLSFQAEFTRRVFVEADPVLADALDQRARRRDGDYRVIAADANAPQTIEQLRAACPEGALGLAFVDNLGLDVTFDTLGRLTQGRRIDLLIVVQVQDLTRNVADVLSGKDDRTRVDAFFGGRGWEDIARHAQASGVGASEIAAALTEFYGQQLTARLGYAAVETSNRLMKNSRNVGIYRLMLAGKHERAADFFQKVQALDYYGQRNLPF